MHNTISISKAARYLGRSQSHLRLLEHQGILLPDLRTSGGHRRYSIETLDGFLTALASHGICILYTGAAGAGGSSRQDVEHNRQPARVLLGMGIRAIEEIVAEKSTGGFYTQLPKILTEVARTDVRRLAITHSSLVPQEALSTLVEACAAHAVQLLFLNIPAKGGEQNPQATADMAL